MPHPDISAKIRKLLARTVAQGASEAEAANALARASELMAQHNLSRTEVETGPAKYGRKAVHECEGVPMNYVFAMAVVEAACEVHCVLCARKVSYWAQDEARIEVFGDSANVEAGAQMLQYLAGVYRDLWLAQRIRTNGYQSDEAGYYDGL